MTRLLTIAFILMLTSSTQEASAQFFSSPRAKWTVAEVKEWSEHNKGQRWQGMLLYRGSDSLQHHFISRFMDEWVWFNINRTDIQLKEEIPYNKKTSSAPLGYYYVDPLKDFIKIKDY